MKFLSIILLSSLFISASAQNIDKQIERYIKNEYPKNEPGGAILVAKQGEIIYLGAFGKASLEDNIKNKPDFSYKIGSISKQFTAVGILMLQEEGNLNVEDPITKYVPDFPEHGITISQLLNHTAGVTNYTNMADWPIENWVEERTPAQMIDLFKDKPLDFQPGTDFRYSNSGYILLGAVIEAVSGMTYAEFINNRILKVVGMDHTFYGDDKPENVTMAKGYTPSSDGKFKPAMELSMSQAYAAGALVSSVGDQYKWIQAIRDNKLIREESREKAWTGATLPSGKKTHYGYGWMQDEIQGSPSIEHGGGIFGFVSIGVYLPQEDIFVSILTNRDGKSPQEMAVRIAAAVMNKPYIVEDEIALTEQQLNDYVAIYDFEDGSSRTITREGDHLISQRSGSVKMKLIPIAKDQFMFEGNEMSRLTFSRDNMNQPNHVVYKFRIAETSGKRTYKEIIERHEIALAPEQLKPLEGEYELDPNFKILVTARDGALYGQATGQPEFQLFALSELHFFLKVVDAEITFYPAEDGSIESLTLFQGGREMPGKKMN